ncbi:hypothetical protein ABIE78_002102 [Sinorhizobium fredii]
MPPLITSAIGPAASPAARCWNSRGPCVCRTDAKGSALSGWLLPPTCARPDFFLFSCQRIRALPIDSALANHQNGVTGIAEVVLSEPNPTDFQYLLQEAVDEREVSAHSFGMDIQAGSAKLSVLNPAGMEAFYGRSVSASERGLRGRAVVFRVADLEATRALFAQNDIEFAEMGGRLIVPEAPGQGVIFAFGV